METSINYVNVKPSLYVPPSSNTEDGGRDSRRDILNALHIKISDRPRKINYIKSWPTGFKFYWREQRKWEHPKTYTAHFPFD
jgi:hypothetical protein